MISSVLEEIGGGGDNGLRQMENQIRPHGRRMEARRPGLGGMAIYVRRLCMRLNLKKEGGRDVRRIGTKFVLGRKQTLDENRRWMSVDESLECYS